ncbi:hypothetical protein NLJ89_g256 [Agrocybe chaxingu]|uniref:NACHT domain-containing protein n=1 Tax=Agrocybe chaxingu TaxID=84603 RepID=A0A9W8N2D9_9AGAR|nr:hypothetical protein NLJ89_g256 [Agrocybe chaxingu]
MHHDDSQGISSMFHMPHGQVMITGGTFTQYGSLPSKELYETFKPHIAANATFDSNDRVDPPRCHPGTRKVLLENLRKWALNSNSSHPVLWFFGPAGSGKTAIARSLAKILAEIQVLGASFFFFKAAETRNNERLFISTIAYQLAVRIPNMQQHVEDSIKADPTVFQQSMETQFRRLVLDPITKLSWRSNPSPKLIVVDGLDECLSREAQCAILTIILAHVSALKGHLKFLIVSRPEFHIESTFERPAFTSCTQRVDLLRDLNQTEDDIRLFITDIFAEIKQMHPLRYLIEANWPSRSAIEKLVQKASVSNFVYARTTMDFIATAYDRPQDRLEVILGLTPTGPEAPYQELDELYRYILSAVRTPIGPVLQTLAIALLGITNEHSTIHGFYGLSELVRDPSFQERILCYRPGTIDLLLLDLRSLVSLRDEFAILPKINFMHTSFSEFLLDRSRSKQYWVDVHQAYRDVELGCLRSLRDPKESSVQDWPDHFWEYGIIRYFGPLLWACDYGTHNSELRQAVEAYNILPVLEKVAACAPNESEAGRRVCTVVDHFYTRLKTCKEFRAVEYRVAEFNSWLKRHVDALNPDDPLLDALTFITPVDAVGQRDPFRLMRPYTFHDLTEHLIHQRNKTLPCLSVIPRSTASSPINHIALFILEEESPTVLTELTFRFLTDKGVSGRHHVDQEKFAKLAVRHLSWICAVSPTVTRLGTRLGTSGCGEPLPIERECFIYSVIEVLDRILPPRQWKSQKWSERAGTTWTPDASSLLEDSPHGPKLSALISFVDNHRLRPIVWHSAARFAHSTLEVMLAQCSRARYEEFMASPNRVDRQLIRATP